MDVVYLSPDKLIPYPQNAKNHPPQQIEQIANSISRFGWKQPIVVDKDNVVVIGHGRLAAAKQLMLDKVPVVYANDLSEDDIKALRLADNKTNESPWDFAKLEEELAALDIAGIDMEQFGFSDMSDDFPEKLDAEDTTGGGKCSIKFTFDSYSDYLPHEDELKELADSIGAEFSVVKI